MNTIRWATRCFCPPEVYGMLVSLVRNAALLEEAHAELFRRLDGSLQGRQRGHHRVQPHPVAQLEVLDG
jgi:hypothetical protein